MFRKILLFVLPMSFVFALWISPNTCMAGNCTTWRRPCPGGYVWTGAYCAKICSDIYTDCDCRHAPVRCPCGTMNCDRVMDCETRGACSGGQSNPCCTNACLPAATTACGASLNNGCRTGCSGTGTKCAAGTCTGGTCVVPYTAVMTVQCSSPVGPERIAGVLNGSSKVKIKISTGTYGIALVPPGDPNASCLHYKLSTGEMLARKCSGTAPACT